MLSSTPAADELSVVPNLPGPSSVRDRGHGQPQPGDSEISDDVLMTRNLSHCGAAVCPSVLGSKFSFWGAFHEPTFLPSNFHIRETSCLITEMFPLVCYLPFLFSEMSYLYIRFIVHIISTEVHLSNQIKSYIIACSKMIDNWGAKSKMFGIYRFN